MIRLLGSKPNGFWPVQTNISICGKTGKWKKTLHREFLLWDRPNPARKKRLGFAPPSTFGKSGTLTSNCIRTNIGDTFDVNVTFPNGYGQTTDAEGNTIDLSGANAVFTTTLNDITVYSLTDSDVTKAFAGYTLDDGSIIDTVDKARTYFEQYARYESVVSYLADYLMTNSVFTKDIPDEIVENEFAMEEAYINELASNNGMTVGEILQSGGYDDMDAYLDASEEYIRQDLQYCFIIQAIAEKLDIEVTEKDIESSYGADADSAVATYGKGYVAQQVLTYLVMDELYTNAQIG